MTMSDIAIESAARLVAQRKLAHGISTIEVEQLLGCELPVETSSAIRSRVNAMFADYLTAISSEAVA